jgi:hypothetical protein
MSTKRRSQREWEGIIEAWERSRLSPGEFCKRRRLSSETFGWWRWRLGKGGAAAGGKASDFVEVAVAPPSASTLERPIVIELPGAIVIRVESGFDDETLRRVMAVVAGGRSC